MEFYARVLDGRGEGFVNALPGLFEHETGSYICRLVPVGKIDGKGVFQIRDEQDNVFAHAHIENGWFICEDR